MAQKIEFKVGLFIVITTLLILAFVWYIAYKKDLFSKVHTYTLSSQTGENIAEGTPVVFWGFNIGQVSSMELTEKGVLVQIKIPERNNSVIRANSRFVLEKPLLSASRIIVYTDNLDGLPLPQDSVRQLTVSNDINELIKRVQTIAEKMDLITGNMTAITEDITDAQGDFKRILKNADTVTSLLAEKGSLIEMLTGDPKSVESVQAVINKVNDITVGIDGIIGKIDAMTLRADDEIYGGEGIFSLVRENLNELLLALSKVESTLENFNQVSVETADATKDLKTLRSDMDEMIISIRNLVDDLDRIIPFKAESEISLP